jgi:hypothetical protein
MENMTIEESNKLIFDFMGCKHSANEDIDRWEMSSLKYHSSWDSLMPVFVKINNTVENEIGGSFINIWWHGVDYGNKTFDTAVYSHIGALYQACIQFIQWYNSTHEPAN